MTSMNALRHAALLTTVTTALTISGLDTNAHASFALGEDGSYIAVVTADNVYVRSGASDGYYPFGYVNEGDLVKVVGDRFNFARIHTTGPTFTEDEFFGFLIYPKTQPGRFRIADDGGSGTTLSRMDVLAPNLITDFNPNDSWKPLMRLEAGEEITVLDQSETRNNIVLHIALPEKAEGWINMRYLRPADEEEKARWQRALAGKDEASKEPEPPQRHVESTEPEEEEVEAEPLARDLPEAIEAHPDRDDLGDDLADDQRHEDFEEEFIEEQVEAKPDAPEEAPIEVDESVEHEPAPAADPDPERRAPDLAQEIADATLEDLEAVFEALREEDVETAEAKPLRDMYLALAERLEEKDDDSAAHIARGRAEQLQIMVDIQERRKRLAELRTRTEMAGERTEAVRLAMEAAGDYTAVGRLTSSTIYDGQRLPLLKRLQDPGTGRTVAYIEPDDGYDLDGMIGQLIGVSGERRYDGGLRLNVIQPRRIDILAPQDVE